MTIQEWDDSDFCNVYEKTWEISVTDTHYGWLSPGENTLGLLKEFDAKRINVLDVGCGMGQNLIALANKGSVGFGLDISPCMIQKAHELIQDNNVAKNITLELGDMRKFNAFSDIEFDLILSIYSMEYLSGIQELRTVIHNLYKRLKPGGVFILCFSHPSQAQEHRYPEIMNKSVPLGTGQYRVYNWSIKDATESLFKAGFSIERIIEQKTNNPSNLSYEEAKKFPYHFKDGQSPFKKSLDDISNGSPHTIIYKARKFHDPLHGISRQDKLDIGYRELWGYKRTISKIKIVRYLGLNFDAIFLAPLDNIIGILDVMSFSVTSNDIITAPSDIEINMDDTDDCIKISSNSILGIIHRKANSRGLNFVYSTYNVDTNDGDKIEKKVFIESVTFLDDETKKVFSTKKVGLLSFVNGQEPSMGELPLDVIEVKAGDYIQLTYIAYMETPDKTDKNQLAFELE